jgi:hypothetical protein
MAYSWALLRIGSLLCGRSPITGPWHLTIGVRRTYGALLGNLGEGWAEPYEFGNYVGVCADQHLRWSIELEEMPGREEQKSWAFKIGDRLEDAWGVTQRRYLGRRGDFEGRLDVRRVND